MRGHGSLFSLVPATDEDADEPVPATDEDADEPQEGTTVTVHVHALTAKLLIVSGVGLFSIMALAANANRNAKAEPPPTLASLRQPLWPPAVPLAKPRPPSPLARPPPLLPPSLPPPPLCKEAARNSLNSPRIRRQCSDSLARGPAHQLCAGTWHASHCEACNSSCPGLMHWSGLSAETPFTVSIEFAEGDTLNLSCRHHVDARHSQAGGTTGCSGPPYAWACVRYTVRIPNQAEYTPQRCSYTSSYASSASGPFAVQLGSFSSDDNDEEDMHTASAGTKGRQDTREQLMELAMSSRELRRARLRPLAGVSLPVVQLHIAKAGGSSLYTALDQAFDLGLGHDSELCWPTVRSRASPHAYTITLLRSPRSHVVSQFEMCTSSPETRGQHFLGLPEWAAVGVRPPTEQAAALSAWTSVYREALREVDWSRGLDALGAATNRYYDPLNLQARALTCNARNPSLISREQAMRQGMTRLAREHTRRPSHNCPCPRAVRLVPLRFPRWM